MPNYNPYDTGSVRPRFHSAEHRQRLAYLLFIDGADLDDLPEIIAYPVRVQLADAAESLQRSDADGFVKSYRNANRITMMLRRIFRKD